MVVVALAAAREGMYVRWFDVVRTSLTFKWHLVQIVDAP